MWCYRRFGHNEGDEPSFTQPLMYDGDPQHPPVSEIYGERLIAEGVIDQAWIDDEITAVRHLARRRVRGGRELQAQQGRLVRRPLVRAARARRCRERAAQRRDRRSTRNCSTALGRTLTTVPDDLTIHKTLARVLDAKRAMFATGENFDWATGEALAFGSLLSEGYGVRLSGQDSGRGTFSQRHAVWVDQNDEHKYVPLCDCRARPVRGARQPAVRIWRARLRIWLCARRPQDAGDVGSAVRRFHERRADHDRPVHRGGRGQVAARQRPRDAAAARLRRAGAGAFARRAPERFLQLCADDNMQVANCTTPANYLPPAAPPDAPHASASRW